MNKLRVAVLMGGTSAERDISLSTGAQIMAALDPEKYSAFALDAASFSGGAVALPKTPTLQLGETTPQTADTIKSAIAQIDLSRMVRKDSDMRPDIVFIALHGKGGEDGTVQGMLELLGIPYTGSGVLASALAMNKSMTKRVLKAEGIPVPMEVHVTRANESEFETLSKLVKETLGYPLIVKPNSQGSTIGCTILQDESGLKQAISDALSCDESALIEQFVCGTEITIGILGNENPIALPIIEIDAKGGVYDYQSKYAPGGSSHIIPARISETAAERAIDYAIRSHKALGCRGMSRVDMIVNGDEPVLLEINTIPGMTPTSLLPDAAKAAGISFRALLDQIIQSTLES